MEEENKEPKEEKLTIKLKKQVEEKLTALTKDGIQQANIDVVYKLVDIHKDLANEEYWDNEKEEKEMRYRDYGNYSYGNENSYGRRGVPGTGRGRYRESGSYRGEDTLDEMKYHYGRYHDSYNTGNYGAKEDSAKKMTDAFVEFGYSIAEELDPNEKMMFKQAMQEIMQELEK